MRDKLPSATAAYVASARALATHHTELSSACRDPYAAQLLPLGLGPLMRAMGSGRRAARLADALRTLSFGQFDHLALRTALIDSALEHALHEGIDQVVLLGAGLDTRAHRMAALERAVVYELDWPATQEAKRPRATALPLRARELRYVPCDFEQASWTDALLGAGFEPRRPTLWLWEGVTMYLRAQAVRQTLAGIAELSAPTSVLLLTYLTPELVAGGERLGRFFARMLGAVAEPIRFTAQPEQMAAELARAGFELLSDALPSDAAPHFEVSVRRPASLMPTEHVAIAIKPGNKTR